MNTAYIYRITIVQIDNYESQIFVDKFGLESERIYTKVIQHTNLNWDNFDVDKDIACTYTSQWQHTLVNLTNGQITSASLERLNLK